MTKLSLSWPTIRFATTTAMLSSGESAKYRYPFHKDFKVPKIRENKPVGRLAVTPDGGKIKGTYEKSLRDSDARSVQLAMGADLVKTVGPKALRHPPPSIRLAHVPGAQGDNNLIGQRGIEQLPQESAPALLVSYYYLDPFLANRERYCFRDWVMDSGAFSAHNSGVEIKLDDYITACKELMASDEKLTEIYALDVIGNWKASIKNAEKMWAKGVEAIPTFHYGSPWDVLKGLAKDYPKIAIGGCVGKRDKDKFAGQCFARAWPCKMHGFGFGSEKSIMMFPFHSVDATNWEMGPCAYGRWRAFGGASISVRGSQQNLRAEVEWYLELEKKARLKWRKEMAQLEALEKPDIRLSHKVSGREETTLVKRERERES